MNGKQFKQVAAGIGVGGAVAMGALGVALLDTDAPAGTGNVGVVSEPEPTLGETVTTTTGQTEIPTSVATPPVIASTPEGMTPP